MTTTPTVVLASGPYEARIAEPGARLCSLTHDGRELCYVQDTVVPYPPYAGAVLAPWPNRIAGGRYGFAGREHQLPITEVERGNALHGLALWERWRLVDATDSTAMLAHTLWPRPGYPFTVDVLARYELGEHGLTVELTAINFGNDPAPVGLSLHPYLVAAPGGVLDDWRLSLPCHEVVLVDEQLIPVGDSPAADAGFDFRDAVSLRDVVVDHAFTGVEFDADDRAEARLLDADGRGVSIGWDRRCGWVQLYTLVTDDDADRRAVAIEPMTCAPDAFNTCAGLIALAPGDSTAMSVTISAVN